MVKKSNRKITENCTPETEYLFSRVFEFDPHKRIDFHELKELEMFKEFFPEDDAYTTSSIMYKKAFDGKNKAAKIDKINEVEDADDDEVHMKSTLVPKQNYTKEIEELEFFFQHKEFIHNMSSTFRREGRYLKTFIKFALHYNLLKFYII